MSGRCSTSFDGRLTGRSSGRCSASSVNASGTASLGRLPASAVIMSRSWASCFCSGGRLACACASAASCDSTSTPAIPPSASCLRKMPSELPSSVTMSCVAWICPRSDASVIAAVTRFDVSVRYVASSW